MVKIDFSLCLRGSGAVVRNYTGVPFETLARWLQPGDVWDGVEQPPSEKSPRYDHKTYNGYLSSVFQPITKDGTSLKPRASLPQPGYRNSANAVARSLITLDFDALPVGTLDRVLDVLDQENILGAVYTTYNNLNKEKGGLERFRAIIVTDRPMYAGEIGRASYAFFDMMREQLPELTADSASFNPAFAMYRPASNSRVEMFDTGEPYSADQLLDDFDEYGLELPVKALTANNWEPATPADMKRCEDWLEWADRNGLTVADGQIWVCCPEHERHSTGSKGDGTDGGAAILLPSARKGEATFKCLHSTCDLDVNRHQRDTMLEISEGLEFPIPEHLLPDPHGGHREEANAKMRHMLAEMRGDSDPEEVPEGGRKQRVRKEGAVDLKDLPNRIAGTYMVDISPSAVDRLQRVSQQFVYVVQGGQSRYFHRYIDPFTKKARWAEWHLNTMKDALANEEGVVGSYQSGDSRKFKTLSLVDALHHWPGRITKAGGAAIFPPPTQCPANMLNTWEGFAVDPEEGDVTTFTEYVRKVLCSGDRDLAHYVLQWLGHMVQHPGDKPGVALVMRSGQGNGKGQLAKLLDRIMGDLFTQYNGTEKLTGQFNITLMTTLLAFIDEAKAKGQENATIKGLVTESRALFEGKGSNQIKGASFTRLIFASNEDVLKISKGDRRYCVLPLDPRYAANDENEERETFAVPYWNHFSKWVKQEWVPAAVLHYLDNISLEGFDEFNAPLSKAREEMVADSLQPVEEFMLLASRDGHFKSGTLDKDPEAVVMSPKAAAAAFREYAKNNDIRNYSSPRAVEMTIGRIFKRTNAEHVETRKAGLPRKYYRFDNADHLYDEICYVLGVPVE